MDKEKKYNKWKSRRWLVCLYWMITLGVAIYLQLDTPVLVALIAAAGGYFMLFTGFETKRKMNLKEKGKENANQ